MSQIFLYRTHIEIKPYTIGQAPSIEKDFSIWDPLYHKSIPTGIYYNRFKETLYLPRGTSIDRLERIFNTPAITDFTHDPVRSIAPIMLKYSPRDEDQKEAIRFILGLDKYSFTNKHTMISLNLNTGKGKTYCAVAGIAYIGQAAIIITQTTGVLDQWKKFIIEYTDIEESQIYYLTGSPSIARLYRKDVSKYKIFLASHGTLNSYGSNNGWDEVGNLFKYLGIGVKIYDESHQSFDNMAMIDFHTNTLKTIYLTATPARSNYEENKIFKMYFNGTPSIDLFHYDTDPHTKYVSIKYNSHPTPMDISKCSSKYGLNRIAYVDYVVRQPNFHKILHIMVNKALSKMGKCLWYVATNISIVYIRDWIYKYYPELVGLVGIYTSIVPAEERASQLDRKIILSTTKSAGAALDIKGLVETAQLAEPFKSEVLTRQTLGRTRDDNTIYKDIIDTSIPTLRKFYNYKKPIFMKYATDCQEVVMSDNELDRRVDAILKDREKLIFPIQFYDDTIVNLEKDS